MSVLVANDIYILPAQPEEDVDELMPYVKLIKANAGAVKRWSNVEGSDGKMTIRKYIDVYHAAGALLIPVLTQRCIVTCVRSVLA